MLFVLWQERSLYFSMMKYPVVSLCLFVLHINNKAGLKNKEGSFDSNAFILFKPRTLTQLKQLLHISRFQQTNGRTDNQPTNHFCACEHVKYRPFLF